MSDLPRNHRSWLRYLGLSALVLVIVAICVGGWMVYVGVSVSLRAEKNLHATQCAICLVDQFVYEKGRWPQSWKELKELQIPSTAPSPLNSSYSRLSNNWPSGLQENVAIDFHADPKAVAQQDPTTFDAIKPVGPCYPYEDFVSRLQETLKKAIERNGQRLSKLEKAANGKETANRLLFPEAIERAMLIDAHSVRRW